MGAYSQILTAIRAAIPAGIRFTPGRLIDFSNEYSGTYPYITLPPFTIVDARGTKNETFNSTTVILGFWEQDSPDTTPAEREAIINAMDILSDTFLDSLIDTWGIKVEDIRKEPQYQMFQGTLSGFAVQARIHILSPC